MVTISEKILVGVLLWCGLATSGTAQTYAAGTTDVGSDSHYVMSEFARTASSAGLGNVQVQEGMALTRTQLAIARGEMELGTIPMVTVFLMRHGLAMYNELGKEQGAELADNLKALFGMNVGIYHAMAFDGSGIDNWEDIKGKRVFVGAPTGGAAAQVQQMIRLITGYEPDTDYTSVTLDWGAGVQAMLDGRVDIVIRPGGIPAEFMDRLQAAGKVVLLGVPPEVYKGEGFQKFLGSPGTVPQTIPADAYDAENVILRNPDADGNVLTASIALVMVTNKFMSDEDAYNLTHAFIEDLDAIENGKLQAHFFALSSAIFGLTPAVGLKMHAGAIKAWEEAGVSIPDYLH